MEAVKKLRKILSDLSEKNDNAEASELFEEIYEDLKYEISEKEDSIKELEDEIEQLEDTEPTYDNSINLGLDTIHFKFEKGNLQIRQQFDSLMQVLNKTPNAVI